MTVCHTTQSKAKVKVMEVRELWKWPISKSISFASMHVIKKTNRGYDTPKQLSKFFSGQIFYISYSFSVTWPSKIRVLRGVNRRRGAVCCCRYNLSHLEQWLRDNKLHDTDVHHALDPIIQASQLLQARKTDADVDCICEMCSQLTTTQVNISAAWCNVCDFDISWATFSKLRRKIFRRFLILGQSLKYLRKHLADIILLYLLIHDWTTTSRNKVQHDAKIKRVNYNYCCFIIS